MSKFGKFLHLIRIRTKCSHLVNLVGISYVYLLDIEKGARPVPSNNVLVALAENLPFEEGEKEVFFDLAAAEKQEIPIDIAAFLTQNKQLLAFIREVNKASLNEDKIKSLIEFARLKMLEEQIWKN